MKILKVYTGRVYGSLGGRDDGHPVRRTEIYNSVEELAENYGTESNEAYFNMSPIPDDLLNNEVNKILKMQENKARDNKRNELKGEIEKLESELSSLQ